MLNVMQRLWHDDRGFVISAELILVATIVVIGLLVGLATYRDALVQELGDTAAAVGALNQSYDVQVNPGGMMLDDITVSGGGQGGTVTIEGDFTAVSFTATFDNFFYEDLADVCEVTPQTAGQPPAGISFGGTLAEGNPLPGP